MSQIWLLIRGDIIQLIVLEPRERACEQVLAGHAKPEQTDLVDPVGGVCRGALRTCDVEDHKQTNGQAHDTAAGQQQLEEGEDQIEHGASQERDRASHIKRLLPLGSLPMPFLPRWSPCAGPPRRHTSPLEIADTLFPAAQTVSADLQSREHLH